MQKIRPTRPAVARQASGALCLRARTDRACLPALVTATAYSPQAAASRARSCTRRLARARHGAPARVAYGRAVCYRADCMSSISFRRGTLRLGSSVFVATIPTSLRETRVQHQGWITRALDPETM